MLKLADKKRFVIGFILLSLIAFGWHLGLNVAPVDRIQGNVYRIIFVHVPAAWNAFFSSFLLLLVSLKALFKPKPYIELNGKAVAEVGLLFTVLTLITGSIWGKPTWGTWWTWDARLTTTLILAILYTGYLLLFSALSAGAQKTKITSVLGIIIFADVPIIYQSVNWWRTIHQPQTIIKEGGSTMDPLMLKILMFNVIVMTLYTIWLILERGRNLKLREKINEVMFDKL